MTISQYVQQQFFAPESLETNEQTLIRLPPTVVVQYNAHDANPQATPPSRRRRGSGRRANLWSVDEHERFLEGLQRYPRGPWKHVAAVVGTKTVRQTMTHAQKYRQKIERLTKRERAESKEDEESVAPDVDASSDLVGFVDELLLGECEWLADMDDAALTVFDLSSDSLDGDFAFDSLLLPVV